MKPPTSSHYYPVSEFFHSVEGEGVHVGRPYFFLRLAGCNVGVYKSPDLSIDSSSKDFPLFDSSKHSMCTTWDGTRFLCDTDFHSYNKMTPEEIVKEINSELGISITGGEPLLHDLNPLIHALPESIEIVHLETSGTLPLPNLDISATRLWVACSPKSISGKSFKDGSGIDVQDVDEWKLIVGPDFKEKTLEEFEDLIPSTCRLRYIQPVNGIHEVRKENLDKCLALLERWPNWRLSSQLHKFIGAR